jgi:pimeloyl-ACP methyl ester carboxylesterase
MAATGKYVEANGLRMYYEVYGEGEPLLLIHGGTATSRSWESHLPAFAEHFRVFAPDSRGHGRTDNPADELGYLLMADDVAALIEALGLQRPLVLGYSDGGQISLELAIRYPGLAGPWSWAARSSGSPKRTWRTPGRSWGSPTARRWIPGSLSGISPTLLITCARRMGTSTARGTGRRT